MKVLVIGGSGFLGSHIVSALLAKGHQVTIGGRGNFSKRFPNVPSIQVDYQQDVMPDVWKPRLKGMDAVVNCIGILNGSNALLDNVHTHTPTAIFTAAKALALKHIVQISAKGTEIDRGIRYSDSKKAADDFLKSLPVSATIIRPSYVYSHGSYGGSSLFRALAAMPFILPIVGKGNQLFQPILANDLAQIILNRIEASEPGVQELDGVGPETITNLQLLEKTREWLGFGKGWVLKAPMAMIGLVSHIGKLIPSIPINRTTYGMMKIPDVAASKPEAYTKLVETTGIQPKGYSQVLAENPSFVQDRWHARLYLIKPLIQIALVLLWFISALTGIFLPESWQVTLQLLLPFKQTQYHLLSYGSIALDVLMGLMVLFNWRPVWNGLIQLVVIVGYTFFITLWLPSFWLHPFGPLLKNIPILVLVLVYMAIASER